MNQNFDKYIDAILDQHKNISSIPGHYYTEYNVKRGLRNPDGTGVLAGLTAIGEVHGYVLDEGTKAPIEGKLRYRGISIEDIVDKSEASPASANHPTKRNWRNFLKVLLQRECCPKTLQRI